MGIVKAETLRETSFYSGPCDQCRIGEHGKCWRAVCHCRHEGWERDVNAQRPHGLSAGQSKDTKHYDGISYGYTSRPKKRRKSAQQRFKDDTADILSGSLEI